MTLPLFDLTAAKTTCRTWGDVQKRYRQPDWCVYGDALDGPFGCWSLCDGLVVNEEFCKECICHKEAIIPVRSHPCLRTRRRSLV